ncbi:hypothetical protein PMAYCL1PPCAC_25455, partial [Pristionchus mayeri]
LTHIKVYNIDNKVTVEFRIRIISSDGIRSVPDPGKFAAPNHMSNVILKIGDKKLHVSKEILSYHSPVFTALFFGDFAEKGKEEVELKDIAYDEFLDLMDLIYFRTVKITDCKVPHIMKLADRFQMEYVTSEAEEYLKQSAGFDEMKKLLFADKYRLTSLK